MANIRVTPYNIPLSSECYQIRSSGSDAYFTITKYYGYDYGGVIQPKFIKNKAYSYDTSGNNTATLDGISVTIPRLYNDGSKTGIEYFRKNGAQGSGGFNSEVNKIPWNITIDTTAKTTSWNNSAGGVWLAHDATQWANSDHGKTFVCNDNLRFRIQTQRPAIFVPNTNDWFGFVYNYDCNLGKAVADNSGGDDTMANVCRLRIEDIIVDDTTIGNYYNNTIENYTSNATENEFIGDNQYSGTKNKYVGIGIGDNTLNANAKNEPVDGSYFPGFYMFNKSLEFDYNMWVSFWFTKKETYTTLKTHFLRTWLNGNVYLLS